MLNAGFATRDITPPRPLPLSGYGFKVETGTFHDGPRDLLSTGVHDPIAVEALTLSDGETVVGLVATDLLNLSSEFVAGVREQLPSTVAYDAVVFTATHTHSAPYVPAALIDVSPLLEVPDPDTRRVVAESIEEREETVAAALTDSYQSLEPATISVGRAENNRTPVNRRALSEDVHSEDAVIDPELLVAAVETDSGERAALVNFACHPICVSANESEVTADYPGVVREEIRSEWDRDATILFVNGAAGDINPRDRNGKEYSYMREIGQEVAETALSALESAHELTDDEPTLHARSRDVAFPIKSLPDEAGLERRLAELTERIDRLEQDGSATDVHATTIERMDIEEMLRLHGLPDTVTAPVQYLEVGELGLVSVPGEAFVRHGLDLKAAASTNHLIVAGYSDEYVGYLPTLEEFEHEGYEVRTAKVDVEGVDRFRTAAFELLKG